MILWIILKMCKGRTQTNGPKDKGNDNDSQSFIPEKCYRQIFLSRKGGSIKDCIDATIKIFEQYT